MRYKQAKPGEQCCRAESRLGFICTRPKGHPGSHAAHDSRGLQVGVWRPKGSGK